MGRRRLNKHPLYTGVLILFFTGVILPLLYAFVHLGISLADIIQAFDVQWIILLLKSVVTAVSVGLLASLAGLVLAMILYKTKMTFSPLIYLLFWFPLFISPYFIAVAYSDFFQLVACSTCFNGLWAVVFVLVLIYTPLAVLVIASALKSINANTEEATLMISGNKILVKNILLPQLKPALFTSFSLIFIFSIANFSVPAYLNTPLITTEIFTQFSAFYRHDLALFQSLLLILVGFILLLKSSNQILSATFFSVGKKSDKLIKYNFSYPVLLKFSVYFWLFLSVFLPFSVLLYQSFSGGMQVFMKAFYLLLPAFIFSFKIALIASFLVLVTGLVTAYYTVRKHKKWLDILLLTGFVLPSIVSGIALLKFYNRKSLDFIYAGLLILLIAYVGKFAYLATKIIANSMRQVPKSLEEIATLQGISSFSLWRKIIIPLNAQALFSAFLIIFVFIIGELEMSIMLYPPGTELLSIKIFTLMANAPVALIASMIIWNLLYLSIIVAIFYVIWYVLYVKNRNKNFRGVTIISIEKK